ncbi:MAG: PDDEXK nuclease domain-containing protein [Syntrophales bacterium]
MNWSGRSHPHLFERLALSRDKAGIKVLSQNGLVIENPADVVKNPYVLEFLDLEEESVYSEHELETAIIKRLEHFLLELGKGLNLSPFSRQKIGLDTRTLLSKVLVSAYSRTAPRLPDVTTRR